MRALPTQGLSLNRHHPDAPGCFFAAPCNEKGGTLIHDVSGRRGKGLGSCVIAGATAATSSNLFRYGSGLTVSNTISFATGTGVAPWTTTGGVSMMAVVRIDSLPNIGVALRCCGITFGPTAGGAWFVGNDGTSSDFSAGVAAAGNEYVIGVRFASGTNNTSIFINGVKFTGTASFPGATSTVPLGVATSLGAASLNGIIRDIRMWDRSLPDVSFERYYYKPWDFYVPTKSILLRRRALNTGMFFPFFR